MAIQTPRSGIFLEISHPQPSPPPPVCFFSGIPYFLLISTRSQINAALLSTASMGIYIEISAVPLNTGLIRIVTSPPFKGTHLLTQLASFLSSLFSLPSFLFHPVLGYYRQFPHPHTTIYCPNPTNQLSLV